MVQQQLRPKKMTRRMRSRCKPWSVAETQHNLLLSYCPAFERGNKTPLQSSQEPRDPGTKLMQLHNVDECDRCRQLHLLCTGTHGSKSW